MTRKVKLTGARAVDVDRLVEGGIAQLKTHAPDAVIPQYLDVLRHS